MVNLRSIRSGAGVVEDVAPVARGTAIAERAAALAAQEIVEGGGPGLAFGVGDEARDRDDGQAAARVDDAPGLAAVAMRRGAAEAVQLRGGATGQHQKSEGEVFHGFSFNARGGVGGA